MIMITALCIASRGDAVFSCVFLGTPVAPELEDGDVASSNIYDDVTNRNRLVIRRVYTTEIWNDFHCQQK